MKTKITLLNGEKYILDGDPQDYMNKMQNGLGVITVETIDVGPKTIDPYDIVMFEKVND